MTKYEIIDKLTRSSGLKKKDVAFVVDNFLDLIIKSVSEGKKIEIRGFGAFYKSKRKERKVFSPIAGKEVTVPAEDVLNFKPSKAGKKRFCERGA